MPDMKTDKFVIIDLETTGLDEKEDVVLEVGLVVVNNDLQIKAEKSWLILNDGWLPRLKENPVVLEMHEKSGLVKDLLELQHIIECNPGVYIPSPNLIALFMWRWLTEDLLLEAGVYPMVGSSVHFDRRFAHEHLIVGEGFFHYRNIDVSSVRALCSAFNPEVYEVLKSDPRFAKENSAHRALPDAHTTLEELRFYREHFLMDASMNDIVEYIGDDERLT